MQSYFDIISGRRRGVLAAAARVGLGMLEVPYRLAVQKRNAAFDAGRGVHHAPRPVVSVGNLTAGGTGKTPTVAWLARKLAEHGHRPAILMRGYKAKPGEKGDEQQLLESLLADVGVPVYADADRVGLARRATEERPDIDVFVLDDGFQHRRLGRCFDLVLIDRTQPFGHGHVLPRGLLREPASGLSRASAVLITRGGSEAEVAAIRRQVVEETAAPLFQSEFNLFPRTPRGEAVDLAGVECVVASGIGNPAAFEADVAAMGAKVVATRRFADHHDFTAEDANELVKQADGRRVVVTGKDWTKLAAVWPAKAPVVVAGQSLVVREEERLVASILDAVRDPKLSLRHR